MDGRNNILIYQPVDNEDRVGGISLLEYIVQEWHIALPAFVYNRVGRCDPLGCLQKPHLGKMATAFDIHRWKKEVKVSQCKLPEIWECLLELQDFNSVLCLMDGGVTEIGR